MREPFRTVAFDGTEWRELDPRDGRPYVEDPPLDAIVRIRADVSVKAAGVILRGLADNFRSQWRAERDSA